MTPTTYSAGERRLCSLPIVRSFATLCGRTCNSRHNPSFSPHTISPNIKPNLRSIETRRHRGRFLPQKRPSRLIANPRATTTTRITLYIIWVRPRKQRENVYALNVFATSAAGDDSLETSRSDERFSRPQPSFALFLKRFVKAVMRCKISRNKTVDSRHRLRKHRFIS